MPTRVSTRPFIERMIVVRDVLVRPDETGHGWKVTWTENRVPMRAHFHSKRTALKLQDALSTYIDLEPRKISDEERAVQAIRELEAEMMKMDTEDEEKAYRSLEELKEFMDRLEQPMVRRRPVMKLARAPDESFYGALEGTSLEIAQSIDTLGKALSAKPRSVPIRSYPRRKSK